MKTRNSLEVGRKSPVRNSGKCRKYFTLIELLVVVAVIAILAGLLFPALGRAKGEALRISCTSNMKQLHSLLMFYASDYNEFLPGYSHFEYFLFPAYLEKAGSTCKFSKVYDTAAIKYSAVFSVGSISGSMLMCPSSGSCSRLPTATIFATTYSPSLCYDVKPSKAQWGGYTPWANTYGGSPADTDKLYGCRKLTTIVNDTVIMLEGYLTQNLDIGGYVVARAHRSYRTPFYTNNWANCLDPGDDKYTFTSAYQHHNGSANFMFLSGSVLSFARGKQFDSDWRPK